MKQFSRLICGYRVKIIETCFCLITSGTCKIENNCTAAIKATTDETGKTFAAVCYTHYGHEKNIGHIWLPKKHREIVGNKLAHGVTRERIMDDIRSSLHGNSHLDMKKVHLTSKEDIKNIKNSLRIHETQRHANDQTSLLSWIQEWKESDANPILYYKLQGDAPDLFYHDLKSEDFIVVIQTSFQKYMAEKLLSSGVCIDSTHGTTGYDFYLTTLLVIDEFGSGFPVAFLLSTHEDETFLKIFYKEVQKNMEVRK